jgi:hypothetical protein
MNEPNHDARRPDIAMAGCTICPRCDAADVGALPRVTLDHGEWCECRICGHIWLNLWATADAPEPREGWS